MIPPLLCSSWSRRRNADSAVTEAIEKEMNVSLTVGSQNFLTRRVSRNNSDKSAGNAEIICHDADNRVIGSSLNRRLLDAHDKMRVVDLFNTFFFGRLCFDKIVTCWNSPKRNPGPMDFYSQNYSIKLKNRLAEAAIELPVWAVMPQSSHDTAASLTLSLRVMEIEQSTRLSKRTVSRR
jgi:hypothetical protein